MLKAWRGEQVRGVIKAYVISKMASRGISELRVGPFSSRPSVQLERGAPQFGSTFARGGSFLITWGFVVALYLLGAEKRCSCLCVSFLFLPGTLVFI